jgi:hypothetical protein
MPLADIENPPQNATDKHAFDFAHQDIHRRLIDYMQSLITGLTLDAFVLDPFETTDNTTVYQHQTMHNELDALLGTPNYDMTSLNWQDAGSRGNWVDNNYQSHLAYSQLTGVN